MKKLPIILGLATLTAGAYTGAMISVDNANAQTQDNQPVEEKPVEIKKDINNLVINNIPNQFYTREAITPTIVILEVEKQLIEGTDFEVEYSNNINVGTATATITFIGEYAELESITKNFDIVSGFLANVISATKSTGKITLSSVENLTEGLVVDFYQGLDLILEEATIISIDLETNSIYTDKGSLPTSFIVRVSNGDVEMFVHNSKSTRAINSWITEPSFTPGDYFNAQEFEMILDNYYNGGNGAGHLDLGEATYGDIIVEVKPQNSNSAYVVMMKKSWMEANNSDDDFGMIAWNNAHEDGGVRPDSWLVGGKTITVRFRVDQSNDYFGLTKTIDITIPYMFEISDASSTFYYDGNEQCLSLAIQDENGENLTEGVDYTVTYSDNVDVGTATATINFIGNYAGALYSASYSGSANGDAVYLTTAPFTISFEIEEAPDQS